MNNRNSIPTGVYVFFSIIIFLVFICMLLFKLTGMIAISWFWVISPLWIPSCMIVFVFLIAFCAMTIKDKFLTKYITKEVHNE